MQGSSLRCLSWRRSAILAHTLAMTSLHGAGGAVSTFAAWSVLSPPSEPLPRGTRVVTGRAAKHPANPLMVQDEPWDVRWDNGYPNVEQDAGGAFHIWYGGFIACAGCEAGSGENRTCAWFYANSTDGLHWRKPHLGIFDLSEVPHISPAAGNAGIRNNVLMAPSDGVGILRDAYNERNASHLFKAIGSGCFSQHGNETCIHGTAESADGLHWGDAVEIDWPDPQRWDDHQNVFFDATIGRYVLTTRDGFSEPPGRAVAVALGDVRGGFGNWSDPTLTLSGSLAHQLYSQITWRFHNIYLGIVMVYNTSPEEDGTVKCKLAWSHNATSGWRWLTETGLTDDSDLIPLSGRDSGEFDSHICFAARPMRVGETVLLYYMGGDGPHSGFRRTALGLATLRPDGFAGIQAGDQVWTASTIPIVIAGPAPTITCDVILPDGYVKMGLTEGSGPCSFEHSLAITSNVTDAVVEFEGGATLASKVGEGASFVLEIKGAIVYTLGFTSPPPQSILTI